MSFFSIITSSKLISQAHLNNGMLNKFLDLLEKEVKLKVLRPANNLGLSMRKLFVLKWKIKQKCSLICKTVQKTVYRGLHNFVKNDAFRKIKNMLSL